MTKEVAKKIARGIADKIECNTADIDDWAEFWGFTRDDYEEFLDMAVKASEQQPNKCEYCHEDSDGYIKPLEKNCHAYIGFGMHGWVIELKAKGWRGKAPIKFCPMCGRRLTNG